jgi:hypothetical protein
MAAESVCMRAVACERANSEMAGLAAVDEAIPLSTACQRSR